MKKFLLSAVFAMVALTTTFAANLNPFAYNLRSELSADQSTLTVNYTLNAAANSVSVRVLQNGQEVKKDTYTGTAKNKGSHTLYVDMSSLPAGTYTWDIQVTGTSVGNPTQVEDYYSFYCPQGLAIDKDPNSNYFGRILVSEAMQAVPASGYISSGKGAGLYVFNPDFTSDGVVYKGGLDFTRKLPDKGYQPWRVKISEDGRIFVSSLDLNGVAVWEVSKDLQTWKPVISGTNNSDDYIIYNSNGSFLAGPNCSMDVIGSGEGLKLLLYSCSKNAIESYNQSWYRLDEYALGTATTFTGTPKNIIEGGAFGVTHNYIDVIYDQAGGYWFGASRGGNASQPNLVHIKADGEEDYRDESDTNYGGGGVLLHNGMLFKGKKYEGGTDGKFGVYTISKNQSTGKLVLTEKYAVTSVGLKRSHNAFAVDYAENLYVVGNDGERIIAFALPYSGSVTTPAAAKYNVVLSSNTQLNPFAYGLRSSLDANNPMQLNVSFSVNASATSVEVVVYDVETNEVAYTQVCPTYSEKHDYQLAVDLSKIPAEYRDGVKNLNWRVDVKGSAVNTPTMIDQEYYFYHPRSIDIDNNPENPNFGHVFVIEGLHDITTKTGTDIGASGKPFNKYLSWGLGAGLYVFDAAFQNLPTPNATAGYNGGLTYTAAEKISVTSNGKTHDYNVYSPNRVKVSDDGRVFITLCAPVNRGVLLEADKYIFSNAEDRPANWSATGWKKVLVGTRDANTEELEDANGNFIAALNCDIDTKGSGKDLQIMLLSGTKNALLAIANQYTFSEYKLGESTQWNSAPTKTWKLDNAVVAYNVVEIVYDNEGGYWMCQDRRNKDEAIKYPTLMHVNKDGVVDLKEQMMNRGGAGICFNKDFTKLIVSGKSSTSSISGVSSASSYSTATLAWATIYTISKVNGAPKLTKEYEIDMTSLGNNIPDFAWDHANNIYACGYSYEKLKAWALPHDADDVISTPAASKYAFELSNEAQLNPFAYNLSSELSADQSTLTVHYSLNSTATSVKVVVMNGNTVVAEKDCNSLGLTKGNYTTTISTTDFPTDTDLTWKVEVKGAAVASPTFVKNDVRLYTPTSIDIDNNPENENFGTVFVVEGRPTAIGNATYLSYKNGAGLYVLNADGTVRPVPNRPEGEYGYNGGLDIKDQPYFSKQPLARGFAPYRVRVSDDGRIFISSMTPNGEVLWEADPLVFSRPDDPAADTKWTRVISSQNSNTVLGTQKRNCTHTDCGIYHLYEGNAETGTFIAGPNIGFDVRGSGKDLKLLMLAGCKEAIVYKTQDHFYCDEYDLGTATIWNTPPSRRIFSGHEDGIDIVNYTGVQVQYDKTGNVWMCQQTGETTRTTLARINRSLIPTQTDINIVGGQVDHNESDHTNRKSGAIRFNEDFTQVAIASNAYGSGGGFTVYPVNASTGLPDWNSGTQVGTRDETGNSLMDFAWDYAGNLYIAADAAYGSKGRCVAIYAMPHDADRVVSTPARDEFVINLTQPVPRIVAYNLTYRPNGATKNYDFSFYANTQPTGGSISFYKNGETTPLYVHQISNLIQGDNTVSIPMATLDEKLNYEKDITWELTLSAPKSQVFGRIYKSGELNTAYATINTNPATDYFGHVYAGNQQNHVSNGSGGNIYVWAPGSGTNNNQGDRYHTIKTAYTPTLSPNNKNGFTQVSAPGIAPDGKVYFTDNGKTGGVYVMDPKDYSITSFFEGLAQNEIAQYLDDGTPVGTPSSSAHIYWPGGNTAKLFLVSTEYDTKTDIGSMHMDLTRYNAGYYIYPLTEQDGQWTHKWSETRMIPVTEDNIYQPNFTIVGTSHGAWYCQHRRNDWDVDESRSLMFFDNNGVRQYCSTDDDEIYGSCGSAIAVNKEETLLAMASGLGGIMFFDIAWSGDIPTLTYKYTSALNNNDVVTTLNFDYNGNLVATVGDTYNDATDKHRMVVFTMPKEGENTVTVPARFSQRVAALYADERMDVHFDEDITNASPYQTVDVFRRLQAGMYNTICLPFSLNSLENTPYAGAKVMKFTGVTSEMMGDEEMLTLNFQQVTFSGENIMQAGVPYLIQPENDITDLLRFSPVQVNASFNNQGLSVTHDGITYRGTINPKRLEVDKNYLFLVANNRLATASAGGDMLGLRGYFTVNKGELPAKAVISFKEGVTTGTTSTVTPTTDGVQKVLQNQQILIIRDGEIYNILGEHINTK